MINDISKPLVFVGSNLNIYKIQELVESLGITIAGMVDDDYHGQGEYKGIPIIAREDELSNMIEDYQFLCVTNWISGADPVIQRNNSKRHRIINLLDSINATQATIISQQSQVSPKASIGKGVIIDAFSIIEPSVTINDHTTIYGQSYVGHDTVIGRNCVLQRLALVTSKVTVEDNVYFSIGCRALRSGSTIKQGTFIHPHLMLLRDTVENEVISLVGHDLRKIYGDDIRIT